MLKSKKYNQTFIIFIFYTIVVLLGFLITRAILDSKVYGRYMLIVTVISMVSALIPSIGKFLGRINFFIVSTLSILIGILYMFYVVIGKTAQAWSELASIVGYLFIVGAGFVLAIVIEIISHFFKTQRI